MGQEEDVSYLKRFSVAAGTKVKLRDIDPGFKDKHKSRAEAAEEIEKDRKKLRGLQELLYSDGKGSLLTVSSRFSGSVRVTCGSARA